MNKAHIRQLYKDLTGGERFRLVVEAEARGDLAERDHLVGSVPRVTRAWSGPEPGFMAPAEATAVLCRALFSGAGPYVGWLELLALLWTPRRGGFVPPTPIDGDGERAWLLALMRACYDRALEMLATMLEAFGAVLGEEAGLDAEAVLHAHLPDFEAILAPYREGLRTAQVDPELLPDWTEGLREVWAAAAAEVDPSYESTVAAGGR